MVNHRQAGRFQCADGRATRRTELAMVDALLSDGSPLRVARSMDLRGREMRLGSRCGCRVRRVLDGASGSVGELGPIRQVCF